MHKTRLQMLVWSLALAAAGSGALAETAEAPPQVVPDGMEMAGHRALMSVVSETGGNPAPFTTDGCSGGLSASWVLLSETVPGFSEDLGAHPPWEHCCTTHDRAYHSAGGAKTAFDSFVARRDADAALRTCVLADGASRRDTIADRYGVSVSMVDVGYAALAEAMYNAVRLGGGPCSGLPWRWGYGFPNCLLRLP